MTDRELLELAAKAAGMTLGAWSDATGAFMYRDGYPGRGYWNPLTDDGDALRLAVKALNWPHGGRAFGSAVSAMYAVDKLPADPLAATRRAIVCAAAEIGRRG